MHKRKPGIRQNTLRMGVRCTRDGEVIKNCLFISLPCSILTLTLNLLYSFVM